MKILKGAIKILCLILAVGVFLTAVFFCPNSVNKMKIGDAVFDDVSLNGVDQSFEKIASSGFIELYLNNQNGNIAVRESSQNYIWYAAPENGCSMLEMSVYTEKGEYILNTLNAEIEYTIRENGVNLKYNIKKDKISIKTLLSITLRDGSLFVESELVEISDDAVLNYISVMPYFGAFKNPDANDFLLIPDGCGSVIYPAKADGKNAYSVSVYGDDYAVKTTDNASGIIGAYGIKKGNSAIAVIIDKAEELATIKAVSDKNSLSRVSAEFKINSTSIKKNKLYYYNEEFSKIALCYKFLSGDNASYSEIASSCREQFIRNGYLPSSNVKSKENTPLFLNLTGSYKKSAWSSYSKYTTFSQALDVLNRLKSKGIDVITVRYTGVFKDNSISPISSLGSQKELENLHNFATAQNISMFLDVNINTYQSPLGKGDLSCVKKMDKLTASNVENTLIDKDIKTVKYRFNRLNDVRSYVSELIKSAEGKTNIGYCIGDAEYLVSNFSLNHTSRTDAKNTISSQIPALSSAGEVIVDKGNMYLIKNAVAVVNIPMETHYLESESYVAIPFVQSVLHGRITMASTPVNLYNDVTTATLKCMEYGVCPAFTTAYSGEDLSQNVLFENQVNTIVESYSVVSKALIGMESERITSHEKLKEGVYLTTYGDTAKIYVNYNDTEETVSGVTISPQSYLRID